MKNQEQVTQSSEAIIMLLLLVPGILWGAFVTVQLWGWFITPFGLPELTIAWAAGLGTIITKFTIKPSDLAHELTLRDYVMSFINSGTLLCFGYICQMFM
jgi:hypothetical protein